MLTPGTRLGPYEIQAAIGAGGMGEVYRARDKRLDRTVAIKVLPAHLAADPEFRERFDREARAVAALNHPHICTLYDIGNQDGVDFLVMEYLEGETLARRLERDALPLTEALTIAIQVASALDTAHRARITHRDLKPGNVMLAKSGSKLLDFGLAKSTGLANRLRQGSGGPAEAGRHDPQVRGVRLQPDLSALPTMSASLTAEGTILGTFQYMAPEQLEGKDADARTDIFAFGALVYEMVTGKKAFEGKSQASLIGAILKDNPPPISTIQPLTPPALDRVVKKCLAKDSDERWQSAKDLYDELKWVAEAGSQATASTSSALVARRATRERVAWTLVAAITVAAIAIGIPTLTLLLRPPRSLPVSQPMLLTVPFPPTADPRVWPEFSPDGHRLAYSDVQQGKAAIWVHRMDGLKAEIIPGSEDANGFFWFPDSLSLGVLTRDKLKKFALTGGPSQDIATVPGVFGGATANDSGVVVYSSGFSKGPLYRTSVNAGGATPVSSLDTQRQETAHLWPQFLPDSRHFIYLALSQSPENSGIFVGSLDSSDRRLLVKSGARPWFVPPSFMLFVRDTVLMAQSFDPRSLQLHGEAQPVASPVSGFASYGAVAVSASNTGLIGYMVDPLGVENRQLGWFDRSGKQIGSIGNPGSYWMLNLSPDGKRIAINLQNPGNKNFDIWIGDVVLGTMSPFIADPSGDFDPEWSPDGRIAFTSDRSGPAGVFEKSTTGTDDPKRVVQLPESSFASDWSADGRFVLYHQTNTKLYAIPMNGDRKPILLLDSPWFKDQGKFSPDNRWVAYDANDSGVFEAYVVSFPVAGRPIQVSTNGGVQPRWRRDGKEMFYLAPDGKMMAVDVISSSSNSSLEFGAPKTLFQTGLSVPSPEVEQYDVTADGQRFIMITPAAGSSVPVMNLIVDWTARLKN